MSQTKRSNFSLFISDLYCAGGASAISKTIVAPFERVKLVLQAQKLLLVSEKDKVKGLVDALVRLPKEQGFLSLWRGNGANLIRIIPVQAIRFTSYDTYKRMTLPKGENGYDGAEKFARKLASGFLSGFTSLLFTYPLDVFRTRLALDFTKAGEKTIYKGVTDCMRKSFQVGGFPALYSGFFLSIFGSVPYIATSMVTYDALKEVYLQPSQDENVLNALNYLGLGSIAGLAGQIITYPIDTIRRRLQINGAMSVEKFYKGSLDCFRKIVAKEGYGALYLGLSANLIKVIPAAAIQFASYDFLKANLFELQYS